jgi:MFS superfamily sulfate permease-like transporter
MQKTWSRDLLSSVVVFFVALPLCMGIAIASGAPPAAGLITGIVGGIVTGMLAGAPLQVSGPAAGLTVLVWELVQKHGIEALGAIVVMAGAIQLLAGVLKLGQWFRAISPAVVYGMLAGIGVLIFASQFHVMVDSKPSGSGIENLLSIPASIYKGIFPVDGSSHHVAAVLGIMTLVILLGWEKLRPQRFALIPGALAGVFVATATAAFLRLDVRYVSVPSNLLEAASRPGVQSFLSALAPELVIAAVTIAFVASAETLLTASAVDTMHTGPRADYDRELRAQGVGNVVTGLLGGLPMTGVIVRSASNVQAGAQTRLSAILHGVWLLALVAGAPGLLNLVPCASLAAILVYTGIKLVSLEKIRGLAALSKGEVAIYAVTLVGIVAVDFLTGVLVGLGLTLARLLHIFTRLTVRVRRQPGGNRVDVELEGAATLVRLPQLARVLERAPAGSEIHIHIEHLDHIDHACLELIANWEKQQATAGTTVVLEWDELMLRYHRRGRASALETQSAAD